MRQSASLTHNHPLEIKNELDFRSKATTSDGNHHSPNLNGRQFLKSVVVDSAELHDSLFASADDILVFDVGGIEDVQSMAGVFTALNDLVQRLP